MVRKWELSGIVQSSSYRTRILESLKDAKTPSRLEQELNIKISHVSRTLKELTSLKLIKCHSPSLRKGKFYQITKLGEEVQKNMK